LSIEEKKYNHRERRGPQRKKQTLISSIKELGINVINFIYKDVKLCFIYFLGGLGVLSGLDIFGCGQRPRQVFRGE
jgi:hypothetical protein